MTGDAAIGFSTIVIGGAMQGVYVLPAKYALRWKWENLWLAFSAAAMLVFPWLLALATTARLGEIYAEFGAPRLIGVALCGVAWGIGCALYGAGVQALGITLGAALILGITAGFGAVVPLILFRPHDLFRPSGLITLAGIAVMLAGIAICAIAGKQRDSHQGSRAVGEDASRKYAAGLVICVCSGILSAALNFGFTFGAGISAAARAKGASDMAATYPLLAMLLSGGFLGNLLYCIHLLNRNGTWPAFRAGRAVHELALCTAMAVLLMGGYVLYGIGLNRLGPVGPSAGWALFLSAFVVSANAAGMLTGEWNNSGARARRTMIAGSIVLIVAACILGAANRQ